jgi:hypothetical protein
MQTIKYYYPTIRKQAGHCEYDGGVIFFKRVLIQNYIPEPSDFKGLNNSEVTLSASIVKSESNVLHLTTLDRDIKLKGETMDTPTGGETWV